MAAVPSIGRADRVSGASAPEADLTRALYERYATQIFRFCLHQLGSREEAEDAVQSTFLNAFRGIKRGVVPELESAWLFKIAENVCLSRRRSTWRRNRIESTADFDLVEELTPAPSRLADELVGLQDVLEQMPESQRRAILLREWQGLSYREIAEELELSQTAVETLIFRARRSLAKGLAEPPGPAEKRRMVRGADLGNLLTGLKSILFGGAAAAAKTAAVVAVVGAGTVAVVAPAQHHARSHAPASPPAPVPAASLPLPRLTPSRQAPVPARPARPAASKAAADTTSTPAIANPPVAPAEATPPQETAGDPAPTSASPVAAQAPPASSPASNGQGKARSEGQGNSGQGKGNPPGEGQGNSGQGQGNPPGEGRGNSGQGSTGDQGQGQRNSGGQGPGDSGNQGQGSSGSSSSDAAPPPTGDSNPGGNSGNGQGNGQGDGGGHGAGAGHGH